VETGGVVRPGVAFGSLEHEEIGMKLRSMLLAATMLALPAGAALAQPISGPYVAGGLGYNWMQNVDIRNSGGAKFETGGGAAAVGSVGWGFGNGLRVEVEGNYRGDHYRVKGGNAFGGMDATNYGVFVNGLYDFQLALPVQPYVGAGFGYELTRAGGGHLALGSGSTVFSNTTKGSAAAQGILGAAVPLGVPGLAATAEYRFMATLSDETFDGSPSDVKIGNQYNHSFLIGLRYAFNSAPPPPAAAPMPAPAPVAAPAPAPARSYLVFFDWDKATLTPRAHQIIAEAAQNASRVQLTKIEVSGYADRTGSAAYNMKLSRQRADNVAAELVSLGVPKSEIVIQAFGDTHLLVPTGPNVREPQNRRVEIVLK
jgi:outer membrane protein OmpA-like peptidoglycan-associated protein